MSCLSLEQSSVGTTTYFNIVCFGLSGNLMVVWQKLLLLEPLPHYRGNVLMERFLQNKSKAIALKICKGDKRNNTGIKLAVVTL